MKSIFIADAHLFHPDDANYKKLQSFLAAQVGSIDRLYLLGDIFEFWLGYRYSVFSSYVPILEVLRQIKEAGCQITFVEGNHDFHMGPYFRETLAAKVCADDCADDLDGQRVHLCHGDLINGDDRGYLRLRRILRSPLTKTVSRLTPTDFAWGVYAFLRRRSQARKNAPGSRPDPAPLIRSYAKQKFAEGNRVVITGHFHKPFMENFDGGHLIALGDWIDQYSYAVCDDGAFRLERA